MPRDLPGSVISRRLHGQLLTGSEFDDPVDVVCWMGALQAQDYGQSLWAVASRLKKPALAPVLDAIHSGRILRTWPMRGTIHWVPAADAAWMVALSAERTIAAAKTRTAQLDINADIIERAAALLQNALTGGRKLARPAVMELWQASGIDVTGQRGYHLLWMLAHRGLIAIGPMDGKQQTFVLLDEWAPQPRRLDRPEALAELGRRYFTSHGPATVQDFAWWAGITVTVARGAVRELAAAATLRMDVVDGRELWGPTETPENGSARHNPMLLAGFDEYLLGYQRRDDVIAAADFQKIVPGSNGIFLPMVVSGGRVVGVWKRVLKAKAVDVTVELFGAGSVAHDDIATAVARYAQAVELPVGRFDLVGEPTPDQGN